MRNLRLYLAALPVLVLSTIAAQAQNFQKSYAISGKASLTISVGDASLELHSCGGCRTVSVNVEWRDRKPSDFDLTEFQTGDHVNFELKEKPHMGFHISMGNHHEPQVTVETPSELDLQGRTADGSLHVSGIEGNLELHTADGGVDISDVGGSLRLTASDGGIHMHNVTGTLESRSSDGHVTIDGTFTALQVHTSDGGLDLTVGEGSHLTTASRIQSSDGQVTVKMPRSLAVDLDVHTSDGNINCELPLTMEGYNSAHSSGHNLRGHLNSGGVPLEIHTSDGNVKIEAL